MWPQLFDKYPHAAIVVSCYIAGFLTAYVLSRIIVRRWRKRWEVAKSDVRWPKHIGIDYARVDPRVGTRVQHCADLLDKLHGRFGVVEDVSSSASGKRDGIGVWVTLIRVEVFSVRMEDTGELVHRNALEWVVVTPALNRGGERGPAPVADRPAPPPPPPKPDVIQRRWPTCRPERK